MTKVCSQKLLTQTIIHNIRELIEVPSHYELNYKNHNKLIYYINNKQN